MAGANLSGKVIARIICSEKGEKEIPLFESNTDTMEFPFNNGSADIPVSMLFFCMSFCSKLYAAMLCGIVAEIQKYTFWL